MTSRYREVQQLASAARPVAVLCLLLGVSRSGYYGWRQRAPSRRQSEDAQLTVELKSAFEQSRRTYGRPRLTRALWARGHRHGERWIGGLMRAAGLCAWPRRRIVPQNTHSRHDGPNAPNRLAERASPPTRPDEVWAVDMTYIETIEGWLFLDVVLDLHSRRVVGWAFAQSLHAALPLAALCMALQSTADRLTACSTTVIAVASMPANTHGCARSSLAGLSQGLWPALLDSLLTTPAASCLRSAALTLLRASPLLSRP